jgi:short-subunit dehydrogenase
VALLARSKDKLESVAEKCRSHNVQAHVIETDLSDKNSIDKSVKEVAQVFPTVHILINNAGIGGGSASALDDKVKSDDGEEDVVDMWERVMNVNLVNTMRITNRILQLMKDVEHGAIITTSSLAATVRSFSEY